MHTINRSLIVVKPKQPFLNWGNSISEGPFGDLTLDYLSKDTTTYLSPEFESDEEYLRLIKSIYSDIFSHELEAWCTDQSAWLSNRTYEMFCEWFEIEVHSMVIDTCGEGIVVQI